MKRKPNAEYLKPSELKAGRLYRIRARNSRLGIWLPKVGGFVISRYKFWCNYLFVEYHWDLDESFGTVLPLKELEKAPFNPAIIPELIWDGGPEYSRILRYLNEADERLLPSEEEEGEQLRREIKKEVEKRGIYKKSNKKRNRYSARASRHGKRPRHLGG